MAIYRMSGMDRMVQGCKKQIFILQILPILLIRFQV